MDGMEHTHKNIMADLLMPRLRGPSAPMRAAQPPVWNAPVARRPDPVVMTADLLTPKLTSMMSVRDTRPSKSVTIREEHSTVHAWPVERRHRSESPGTDLPMSPLSQSPSRSMSPWDISAHLPDDMLRPRIRSASASPGRTPVPVRRARSSSPASEIPTTPRVERSQSVGRSRSVEREVSTPQMPRLLREVESVPSTPQMHKPTRALAEVVQMVPSTPMVYKQARPPVVQVPSTPRAEKGVATSVHTVSIPSTPKAEKGVAHVSVVQVPSTPKAEKPVAVGAAVIQVPSTPKAEKGAAVVQVPSTPKAEKVVWPTTQVPSTPKAEKPVAVVQVPSTPKAEKPVAVIQVPSTPKAEKPVAHVIQVPSTPKAEKVVWPVKHVPSTPKAEKPVAHVIQVPSTPQAEKVSASAMPVWTPIRSEVMPLPQPVKRVIHSPSPGPAHYHSDEECYDLSTLEVASTPGGTHTGGVPTVSADILTPAVPTVTSGSKIGPNYRRALLEAQLAGHELLSAAEYGQVAPGDEISYINARNWFVRGVRVTDVARTSRNNFLMWSCRIGVGGQHAWTMRADQVVRVWRKLASTTQANYIRELEAQIRDLVSIMSELVPNLASRLHTLAQARQAARAHPPVVIPDPVWPADRPLPGAVPPPEAPRGRAPARPRAKGKAKARAAKSSAKPAIIIVSDEEI